MGARLGFVLSAALLATVVAATPAQAATTITDLGGLEGSTFHGAVAINDAGVVVGRSRANGRPERGVEYDGVPAEVAGPAGLSTRLKSINSSGVIAGSTAELFVHSRAIRFQPDGTYQVLPSIEGYDFGAGHAIDDSGTVYGTVANSGSSQLPVKWDANGVLTALAMPTGMTWGLVTGASNGYAVGYVSGVGIYSRAVRWNPDGTVTSLARLEPNSTTYARAVNRHGEVVGEAYSENNLGVLGVRWNIDGTIITTYGGNAHPRGINDHGIAVGFNTITTADNRPVRWSANGDALELGSLNGARKAEAVGINNDGVIVGYTGEGTAPVTALKWTVS